MEGQTLESVVIDNFFHVEKFRNLWVANCIRDKDSTLFGTMGLYYVRDTHKAILIDGGNVRDWNKTRRLLKGFLHEFGLHWNDITTILFTHLHWDHTGIITQMRGGGKLQKATCYASPGGIRQLQEKPDDAFNVEFVYEAGATVIDCGNDTEELRGAVEELYRERPDWMLPLGKCDHVRHGLYRYLRIYSMLSKYYINDYVTAHRYYLGDTIKEHAGILWAHTFGHSRGGVAYLLQLAQSGDELASQERRHLFLGDSLAHSSSKTDTDRHLQRIWSSLLRSLRTHCYIHPGHLDIRTKKLKYQAFFGHTYGQQNTPHEG